MTGIIGNLKSSFFFEQKHLYMLPAIIFQGQYPYYRIKDILSRIAVDNHSPEAVPMLVIDAIEQDTIIWTAEQKRVKKEKRVKYVRQPLPDRFGFN